MVWANTTAIGCGQGKRTIDGYEHVIWVCNYAPTGNYIGQRPYSVNTPPVVKPLQLKADLPTGTAGSPYHGQISATGGTAPYIFSADAASLPQGLHLAADGVVSGTPADLGPLGYGTGFTVTVRDAAGRTAQQMFTIQINPRQVVIVLGPSTLPGASTGQDYQVQLTASGGYAPYRFAAAGTMPSGLYVSSSGVLSGVIRSCGVRCALGIPIRVTDAFGNTAARTFSLRVQP